MRKSLLLFAMGLVASLTVVAQQPKKDSPWTGTVLPEEGGTYYMSIVETGLWLQHNRKQVDYWT